MEFEKKNLEYGKCRWSDELKIDVKGTNCPEYIFWGMFKELWK